MAAPPRLRRSCSSSSLAPAPRPRLRRRSSPRRLAGRRRLPGAAVVSGALTSSPRGWRARPRPVRAAGRLGRSGRRPARRPPRRTARSPSASRRPSPPTTRCGSAAERPSRRRRPTRGLTVQPRVTISSPPSLWLGETVLLRGAVAPAHPAGRPSPSSARSTACGSRSSPPRSTTVALRAAAGRRRSSASTGSGARRRRTPSTTPAPRPRGASSSTGRTRTTCRCATRTTSSSCATSTGSTTTSTVCWCAASTSRSAARATARRWACFRIYGKRKPAGGALGACAMFYRHKGGIAIHGTEPARACIRRPVPRDFSHGCARMLNRQVLWLYDARAGRHARPQPALTGDAAAGAVAPAGLRTAVP